MQRSGAKPKSKFEVQVAALVSGTFSLGLKFGFKRKLEGSEGC